MHSPVRSPRPRAARLVRAAAVTAACALTSLALVPASQAVPARTTAAQAPAASAEVDDAVRAAVAGGGDATFFVVLKDRADLSSARTARGDKGRAKAAFAKLRAHADASQKALRAVLDAEKAGYEPFWITNAVKVTGGAKLVEKLAKRPDVARIVLERTYAVETDAAAGSAAAEPAAEAVEWGVADIGADQVWSQYGARGEGVVIANIDTGVQGNHPALKANYRGWNGSTSTDDYNFFDATGQCAGTAPCDDNGHGTHTMGTMAGSGGIGVAPGARWIAAKGCEARSCSDSSLLAAGQWILAPTDSNGHNPRPEMAPDIVNNSWGGGNTTFYADVVAAWRAAGIFETFSAGNDGDGVTCSTAKAPGAQAGSYGVGAYDSAGAIAPFSGFGPSLVDGSAKPNISAPGVDIRSAWPGSTYRLSSGTSMAAPHVAGAVALLWSAAPSLAGNLDATRTVLNDSARDVDDTHCGGTAGMNNVWGEGKLDVFAAVDAAPHTSAIVTGTLTDATTGRTLAGVTVTAANPERSRTTVTGADGSYRLTLPPGSYALTASGYGYRGGSTALALEEGTTADGSLALAPVPHHAVTGTVLDAQGGPLGGVTVRLTDAPVAAVTAAADGTFTLPDVAEGSFTLTGTPAAPALCDGVHTGALAVDGDESVTVRLPARTDAAGAVSCAPVPYAWVKGKSAVALSGDEDAATIPTPFPVSFYGVAYDSLNVTSNGLVNFLAPRLGDYADTDLPSAAQPNGIVAAYWDDLTLDRASRVSTATTGRAGARVFTVSWENAALVADPSVRVSFQALFDEATGAVTLQYKDVAPGGASATVGVENQSGTDGLAYLHDRNVLKSGTAIRFTQESAR
ncbi:S8 family serine peptidase [Streptomyces sp. NPDC002262]|uniref:S8 family serine peptidase n=1 Tax=Streptomyces sp. NPDC002262 TaxID=3154414 RepID=UPI003329E2CF